MEVKIKRKHPGVKIPTYGTEGAACFDIYADLGGSYYTLGAYWEDLEIPTGLFFEIPEGKALLIYSRSGHGFKNDIRLSNSVGVIDSDYRGELKVKLRADSKNNPLEIDSTTKIAQGMIIDVPKVSFSVVEELSETQRGTGGFGSTDK